MDGFIRGTLFDVCFSGRGGVDDISKSNLLS